MTTFKDLGLHAELLRAVEREGYETPTEIQAGAIPAAMEGRDVLALAPTGTGKTAGFTLPILHRLLESPLTGPRQIRALILTPTRELALQVNEALHTYARFVKIRTAVVLGGVGMGPQIQAVKRKPEILVATPGRLEDLIQQGHIDLSSIETFVLDEADRMLDMGFIPAVRRLERQMPEQRQTLLFSATMPREIENLADTLLVDPVRVEVERKEEERGIISQRLIFVNRPDKQDLLEDLIRSEDVYLGLVFARTKFRADACARKLRKAGIQADAIHGNKTQAARQRALKAFTQARLQILVATDIAARGIDVDDVTHVFNFDLADDPESHVHRIGRTGRAGKEGIAISFCDETEAEKLVAIERVIGEAIPVEDVHELSDPEIESLKPQRRGGRIQGKGKQGGRRKQGSGGNRKPQQARGQRSGQRGQRRDDRRDDQRDQHQSDDRRTPQRTAQRRDEGEAGSSHQPKRKSGGKPHGKRKPKHGDQQRSGSRNDQRNEGQGQGPRHGAKRKPKQGAAKRGQNQQGAKSRSGGERSEQGGSSSNNPLDNRRKRKSSHGGSKSAGGSGGGNRMQPRSRGEKLMDQKRKSKGKSPRGSQRSAAVGARG